ncbi:uncharacterized protein LOC131955211 [Physella acuta]|uniref:uncharacterized protein LOC131955211 n=1 Tax=Physella acuta TaxID=109671 RepID=UPI0027DC65D9|nr:uncharacterized protein LOC131955211 [Physella acuta]
MTGVGIPKNHTSEDIRNYLDSLQGVTTLAMVPSMVFLAILAIVGLVGNSLVLVVYSRKFKRNAMRIFIMTMACFDLLSNVVIIPGDYYEIFHHWDFDKPILCRLRMYSYTVAGIGSSLSLIGIAATRYRKISQPFSTQVTTSLAAGLSVTIAIVSFTFAIPYFILNGVQTKATEIQGIEGHSCTIDDRYLNTIWPKLNAGFFMLLFVVTSTTIVVTYSLIGMKTRGHRKKRSNMKVPPQKAVEMTVSTEMSGCSESTNKNISKDEKSEQDLNIPRQKQKLNVEVHATPNSVENKLPHFLDNTSTGIQNSETVGTIQGKTMKIKRSIIELGVEEQNQSSHCTIDKKQVQTPEASVQSFSEDITSETLNDSIQRTTSGTLVSSRNAHYTLVKRRQKTSARCGVDRTTCMLLTVSLIYVLSFLPFLAMELLRSFIPVSLISLGPIKFGLYHLFLRSYLLNTAMNPIIYNLCDLHFRRECSKLFLQACACTRSHK